METCSLYNTTQFQAERGIFQSDVQTRLSARYDALHTDTQEIQVGDNRDSMDE